MNRKAAIRAEAHAAPAQQDRNTPAAAQQDLDGNLAMLAVGW